MKRKIPAPVRPLVALLLLGGFLVAPEVASPAAACASDHGRPYLTGLRGEGSLPGVTVGSNFYAAAENAGPATATIAVTPGHCTGGGGETRYRTLDGSALAPSDYSAVDNRTPPLCDDIDSWDQFCDGHPPRWEVEVPVANNASPEEPAVESFEFELYNGFPSFAEPSAAPVHIIDVHGTDRISLEPTLAGDDAVRYEKQEFGSIRVPVFWAGPDAPQDVHYTVEPDPVGPAATPGVDYTVATQNPLPASAFDRRVAFIRIDIVGDRIAEPDEVILITLEPDPTYEVEEPSSTTFTILDNEDDRTPPVSRFHHPRHRLQYSKGDYRIREFHTFFRDNPDGSGVVAAQMALRRKMEGGACGWWNGERFRKGSCTDKVWKNMRLLEPGDLFFYRMPALRPTGGTNVKHYRAWTRTMDAAENLEATFEVGRNLSTFWIKRK